MDFGTNLRRLRAETGITQETLAQELGITPQSVSKWERGENYPDIVLLPAIAERFEITVDELLQADSEHREREILRIQQESIRIREEKSSDDAAVYLQDALKRYPNADILWLDYASYIGYGIRVNSNRPISEEGCREAITIYERVLNRCTDDNLRVRALRCLSGQYETIGDKSKALELTLRLPSWEGCREIMLPYVLEGEGREIQIHRNFAEVAKLFHTLTQSAQDMDNVSYVQAHDNLTIRERIAIIKKGVDVLELLTDGDDNFRDYEKCCSYRNMARLAAQEGESEEALDYLEKALEHAIKAESPEKIENSLLLRGINKGRDEVDASVREMRAVSELRDYLKPDAWQYTWLQSGADAFAAIRGDARFEAVITRLEEETA